MAASHAELIGIGLVSPVGLSAGLTEAAVRAEVNRFKSGEELNRQHEPMILSRIADDDLPPFSPDFVEIPDLTPRKERMIKLGGMALHRCFEGASRAGPIPLLIGVPEALPVDDRGDPLRPAPVGKLFPGELARQAGVTLDLARSCVFPSGRAAGILALKEALTRLSSGEFASVVVGGVDSYIDIDVLLLLDQEDRVQAEGIMDGFIPGEGAAFLWLAPPGGAARLGREVIARVDGAFVADEPGHRYSKKVPYRGEGLDAAFRGVFDAAPGAQVRTVYAGFTGESLNAKEWGVAYLRHKRQFAEDMEVEHPADCFGDTGAALGPMMVALCALGLKKGIRSARCLVWCSSDLATRGAALLSKV